MDLTSKTDFGKDSQMRPIERDILLADSGELPVIHRMMLRVRLLGDPEARRYARALRAIRTGVGVIEPHRSPLPSLAFASLAAAAALALTVALWPRSAPTVGSSAGNDRKVTKTGDVLETPLIAQTRLLAIQAEQPASPPPARGIIVASLSGGTSTSAPSTRPPLWSSLPFTGPRGTLTE